MNKSLVRMVHNMIGVLLRFFFKQKTAYELRISDWSSVVCSSDLLDLELKRGMSVISGETGAGKSIMLDALGLTLGDRADSSVVRIGADKADILASFDLDDIPDARAWLAERDMAHDGPCLPRPTITPEGHYPGPTTGPPLAR